MNQVFDSVASVIIGSLAMLMLNGLMGGMRSSSVSQTQNAMVQTNLVTVTDILESDFRKMGYRLPASPKDSSVLYADTTSIVIKGDLDNNGTSQDSIRYSFGTTKPSSNFNPRTRFLFRKWNNGSNQILNVGLTRFRLTYYDGAGNQILATPKVAKPSSIRAIKLTLKMESTHPSEIENRDTTYSYAVWEEVMKPNNLK